MDESAYGYWLPPDASAHGPQIDHLLILLHVFMAVIFIGWLGFLVFCLIKFRARADRRASYEMPRAAFVKYAEFSIIVIELLLLFGVSTPIWWRYKQTPADEANALHIKVVAEQYAWNVHYPGKDNKFGKAGLEWMSSDNPLGLDPDDAAGKDDLTTINQLHVPLGRTVIVDVTSKDVIHGFNIPVLRIKADAIPGQQATLWFTGTKVGHYELACAQLCGLGHYRMRGDVYVDTPEDFAKWEHDNAPTQPEPTK
jgi:cytochrome c oxidase subunit 2